jgi:hypothetical protein
MASKEEFNWRQILMLREFFRVCFEKHFCLSKADLNYKLKCH